MNHKEWPIARDGFIFIIPLLLIIILSLYTGFFRTALFFTAPALFVLWFFRNPERTTPENGKIVVSPADGTILKIERVEEEDLIKGSFIKISIFMSVFNVHVNRMPCSGIVKAIRYHKGSFFSANLDKASRLNERNSMVIETAEGYEILTIQIAGLIARRIVCWVQEGMKAIKGERFGLIRFGSRLELFLPLETKILVNAGDKVKSGETEMGQLP